MLLHGIKRIVLATGNLGKVKEIQAVLADLDVEIVPQTLFQIDSADETGLTFVENAILKARHASRLTGLPAIADDSGLEIDALNGAPGIYSARYAGPDATDKQNNQRVLNNLHEVAQENRQARFHCVIVLMRHALDPVPLICHGSWEGRVLDKPVGDNGFGYDPLFYVPTHKCSSAQLSPEVKNRISHRGQALAKLVKAMHEGNTAW